MRPWADRTVWGFGTHWAFHPKIVARYFYSLTVSFPDATDVLPPPPHTWMKCLERLGARHED